VPPSWIASYQDKSMHRVLWRSHLSPQTGIPGGLFLIPLFFKVFLYFSQTLQANFQCLEAIVYAFTWNKFSPGLCKLLGVKLGNGLKEMRPSTHLIAITPISSFEPEG